MGAREAYSTTGAGITGCLLIKKNTNRSISITPHKTQVHVDHTLQHKTGH
jgi:tRNA A37 threonylcarbamoyltransferase TsaD